MRDETGDRRFWVVPVDDMNLPALLALPREWFILLWSEIYLWWQQEPEGFRLAQDERRALDAANQTYRETLPGEEEIRLMLDWDLPADDWGRFSAAELLRLVPCCGAPTAA